MNKEKQAENAVHFVLMAKGGCGKTFIATLLAQYFASRGLDMKGFDTDQENRDFFAYKSLPVRYVDVMAGKTTIDQKKFDAFMEALLTEDGVFVVDNGANTFTPLLGYLVENDGLNLLKEAGRKVYLHGVIGGGDNYQSTSKGFTDLVVNSDTPVVLWLNEHFGDLADSNGQPFVTSENFKKHRSHVAGAVMLHKRNPQTYGEDIKKMTKARLTLDEVMSSSAFTLMEKQRLRVFAKDVFEQLDKVTF
ncbi:hypothetical protein [Propionivibrio soli]|uniref:nucleotide-binding protein n=1 Tax=Propionivibrio soli TaxID=2976531 RepID=UPI0021E7CB40|nr:hypothetical protein [Propionivibrio soli]